MAQDDYVIDNAPGATFRADLNSNLAAVVTQNSGTTAPSTTYAGQYWWDTTNNLIKIRNSSNNGWIDAFNFDGTTFSPSSATFNQDLNTTDDVQFNSVTFDGANQLSNYIEDTSFTPVFDFSTTGDLSVNYHDRAGRRTRIGNMAFFTLLLDFTPTYTTSSGVARFTGIPDSVASSPLSASNISFDASQNGFTRSADYQYLAIMSAGAAGINMTSLESSTGTVRNVGVADIASGTRYKLTITGQYRV